MSGDERHAGRWWTLLAASFVLNFSGFMALSVAGLMLLAGTGCGAVSYRQDGSVVRHHFGYVRVITPRAESADGKFEVMELSTFGVRFHEGAGLGYFHERTEYIPMDSRLVIRVANEAQMNQVLKMLKPTEKDKLCITITP